MRFQPLTSHLYSTALCVLAMALLASCHGKRLQDRDFAYKHLAEDTLLFAYGEDVGTLANDDLLEVSGLAASPRYLSVLWAHNDSGHGPYIYALDTNGAHLARFEVATKAVDWEAMAAYQDATDSTAYLYIADFGDNEANRPHVTLYRLPEPDLDSVYAAPLPVDSLRYSYPDGARDAEGLLVDPANGEIFVITKREDSVHVYQVPAQFGVDSIVPARELLHLPMHAVTDASVNPQTGSVLLRTYDRFFLFRREGAEPLSAALQRVPIRLPYFPNGGYEPQGEAVTWDATGTDFFSLSEEYQQNPAVLYRYRRK